MTEDGKPGWKDGADTVHPFNSYRYLVKDGIVSAATEVISTSLNNLAYSNTYKAFILQNKTGSDAYGTVNGSLTMHLDLTGINRIYINAISRSSYFTTDLDGVRNTGNIIDTSSLSGAHTITVNVGNQSKVTGMLPNDGNSVGVYDVYVE